MPYKEDIELEDKFKQGIGSIILRRNIYLYSNRYQKQIKTKKIMKEQTVEITFENLPNSMIKIQLSVLITKLLNSRDEFRGKY